MSVPIYTGGQDRVPLSDLIRELFHKFGEMLNAQITLAKTEVKVESRKLAMAAAFGGGALLIGFFFVLFFGVSLTLLLARAVDLAWASLITTGLYLVLAIILGGLMIKEIRKNSAEIDVDT